MAEISFDFEDESAMMSPASVDDAELESDSTGDVTVVMSSKRGRLSRVNETFNVFKSLAQLAISPSELDVSKRRAPTPMNTPATTLTFDDDVDSPVVQARTEADLRDTVEKIASSLVERRRRDAVLYDQSSRAPRREGARGGDFHARRFRSIILCLERRDRGVPSAVRDRWNRVRVSLVLALTNELERPVRVRGVRFVR